jgi:hypothetical protein
LIKCFILFLEIDQRGATALKASPGCPRRTAQYLERKADGSLAERIGLLASIDLETLPGPKIRTWGTQILVCED